MRFKEIHEEKEQKGHEGGAPKKFEDDLITLAKLSTSPAGQGKDIRKVYDENVDKFLAPSKREDAIQAIKKLNNRWPDETWIEGHNSNFGLESAPAPRYGVKSAKSDIVLNDIPLSVKLSGAFVVASAQNKEEFEGIFTSALDYYADKHDAGIDITEEINQLKASVAEAKTKYIGEVKQRVQKQTRNQSVLDKFSDVSALYEGLEKYMHEVEGKLTDYYALATAELKKGVLKKISTSLKNNPLLKQYVVWEALSSSLKYDFQFPYATHVISPSGVFDISTPDSPYVIKCAKVSKFDIRGLPTGSIRSGSKAFASSQKGAYASGKVDIPGIFDAMNQMAFGMKIDVSAGNAAKLKVDEAIDVKGFFTQIIRKIKEWFRIIGETLNKFVKLATQLKEANVSDWAHAVGIEATGEIKMV